MKFWHQIGGIIVLIVAIVIASFAYAASPYEERLGNDVARLMGGSDSRIPDAVEADYWRCWARGFVQTQVHADDRPGLDAGDSALVKKTGERLEEVLTHPDGRANYAVEGWMDRECPGVVDKLRSYL